MPQVAAAVTANLTASLFLSGLSIGVATVISNVIVSLATNLVLGALSKALTPKPKQQSVAALSALSARDRTLAVRQPITVHRIIYGRQRVSGPYTFMHSTENNKFLHLVITLAAHEVEEIGDIYFNDELVPLDSNGNATGRYAGHVLVRKGLGTAYDAAVIDTLVANTAGLWTVNHRQSGRAKIYVRLMWNQDLFAAGLPNITAIVRGKKVLDPRTGATVYSDNTALCLRDYLSNSVYGLGEPAARIDNAAVIAAANVCDENVALKAGGTEKRYTCNGIVETDVQPKEVIGHLQSSYAGICVYSGGKWRVLAGSYRTPTISLSEKDLDGPIQTNTRVSRRELFNAVKGVFVNPAQFWQPTDFPSVTNATYLGQDQNDRIWKDVAFYFTTSAATAQRLAKIELERARQQITTVWPCNLAAMRLRAGDVVNLNNARFGWINKPFDVVDWQFALRGGGEAPRLGIDLTLRETASTVYDWASGEETVLDPAPDTNLPSPFMVAAPGIPAITESKYVSNTGGGVKVRATVSWSAADQLTVFYQAEHKLSTAAIWTIHPRTTGTWLDINDIAPGIYDFRVKAINSIGVSSTYSAITQEIRGLGDKPAALTGLTIQSVGGLAILQWRQSVDLDVRVGGKIVFRHSGAQSGASYSQSASIGESVTGDQAIAVLPLLPGTYFAVAVDSSGISSDAASVSTAAAQVLAFSPLSTVSEHPVFSGAKSGVVAVDNVLKLDGAAMMDSWGLLDDIVDWDSEGGITSSGVYTFATGIDLGSQRRVRLRSNMAVIEVNTKDFIDSRMALMDDWPSWDGVVGGSTDAQVWARATNDDPNVSPTWGTWEKLASGEYNTRAFQFQARLSSSVADYNVEVSQCSVTAETV